jgi:hypothetical protein
MVWQFNTDGSMGRTDAYLAPDSYWKVNQTMVKQLISLSADKQFLTTKEIGQYVQPSNSAQTSLCVLKGT